MSKCEECCSTCLSNFDPCCICHKWKILCDEHCSDCVKDNKEYCCICENEIYYSEHIDE